MAATTSSKKRSRFIAVLALTVFSCYRSVILLPQVKSNFDFSLLLYPEEKSKQPSKSSSSSSLRVLYSLNDSSIVHERNESILARPTNRQQEQVTKTLTTASTSAAIPANSAIHDSLNLLNVSMGIEGVAANASPVAVATTAALQPARYTTKATTTTLIPSLKSLVNFSTNEIKGDVQFLLDYAVVGFAKCGTTTLSLWLDAHPEISDFPHEVWDLYHGKYAQFIKLMHDKVQKEDSATRASSRNGNKQRIIHGYKNPGDITNDESLKTLTKHFSETKLIVTMRHPILFFQSFYNYRASLRQFHRIPGKPNDLIGPTKRHDILATAQAAFHVFLASLGKTDMTSEEERQLLRGFYKDQILDSSKRSRPVVRMPHKVFLMEMTQLADKNETRSTLFRHDLQHFLGLQQPLPLIPHARPNAQHETKFQKDGVAQNTTTNRKIDICHDEHLPARQELFRISRAASRWIRDYFLKSPDVIVSSPSYFDEVLDSWMVDPCISRSINMVRHKNVTNATVVSSR